ncbi:MAG: his operon leader peptide [Enterobacter asburiae]|nr:his operon leader peptide [Enterobacter asburiae]
MSYNWFRLKDIRVQFKHHHHHHHPD